MRLPTQTLPLARQYDINQCRIEAVGSGPLRNGYAVLPEVLNRLGIADRIASAVHFCLGLFGVARNCRTVSRIDPQGLKMG